MVTLLTSLANMVIPLTYLTVSPKLLSFKILLYLLKNDIPTPPAHLIYFFRHFLLSTITL